MSWPIPGSSKWSKHGPITTGLPLASASRSCQRWSASRAARSSRSAAGAIANQPGPGCLAEHRANAKELVLRADLAGQARVAGSDVADDLIGREAERAELERAAEQRGHARDLVGRRGAFVHGVGAEHRGADRHVAGVGREVEERRRALEAREVLVDRRPVERNGFGDRLDRDLLDLAQRLDDVVARRRVAEWREAVAAVAGDDGRDPEARRRREVGIPEQVGVEVRVRVDESGCEHEAAPVELFVAAPGAPSPTATIVPARTATSASRAGPPLPSTTVAPRTTRSNSLIESIISPPDDSCRF